MCSIAYLLEQLLQLSSLHFVLSLDLDLALAAVLLVDDYALMQQLRADVSDCDWSIPTASISYSADNILQLLTLQAKHRTCRRPFR